MSNHEHDWAGPLQPLSARILRPLPSAASIDRQHRNGHRPSDHLRPNGAGSDQPESLDRVTFLGQLGHRGIDPAAREVVDVQSLDDLP
jgi:hypothetical protein